MSLLTIDIRAAQRSDVAALSAVHYASWQHAYGGLIPYKSLQAMVNRRDHGWWARAIDRGTSISVIDMGDTICGYATMGLNRAPTLPQDGEIYELYLLPEYQGIGLGRRLFNAARQTLQSHGCKGLVVWALEDNEPANQFYNALDGRDVAQGYESFDGKAMRKIAYIWP
ncbi:MAG: GNAT family N-acetyltransferase [Ahrensia sp.]